MSTPHAAAAIPPTTSEMSMVGRLLPSAGAIRLASLPPRYAPTHIKPAWPSDSSPRKPTTRLSETARIMLIEIFSSRNSVDEESPLVNERIVKGEI